MTHWCQRLHESTKQTLPGENFFLHALKRVNPDLVMPPLPVGVTDVNNLAVLCQVQ